MSRYSENRDETRENLLYETIGAEILESLSAATLMTTGRKRCLEEYHARKNAECLSFTEV